MPLLLISGLALMPFCLGLSLGGPTLGLLFLGVFLCPAAGGNHVPRGTVTGRTMIPPRKGTAESHVCRPGFSRPFHGGSGPSPVTQIAHPPGNADFPHTGGRPTS